MDHPAQTAPSKRRSALRVLAPVSLVLILLLAGVLYLRYGFGNYLDDDEGTYAYAAWRVSLGEVPYRDFLTSEMPAFLYWGGLVVRFCGRSFVALRLATMAATLAAAYLLYATSRELFGHLAAILSLGLFLIEPNVFHGARYFRAEAYMLLFEVAGLYFFVLAEKRARPGYAVLAGALFGLSILCKLFGLLPLAGCLIYLVYAGCRERRPCRLVLQQAVALILPAAALIGLVAVVCTWITPYFVTAVFGHHTMQGAGMPLAERAARGWGLLRGYASGQRLAIVLAGASAVLALLKRRALPSLLIWQAPTALAFLGLSRDLYERYLTYLAPAVTILMAVGLAELVRLASRTRLRQPWRIALLLPVAGLALALALGTIRPWMVRNLRDVPAEEHDSAHLADLIRSVAAGDEAVITDYPGLNFLAGRRSTYWAAELSGVGAQSGQITGAALIDEIEREKVAAVLIHTEGAAHHLVAMADYPGFRRYVQLHYVLVDGYQTTYGRREFEVYARADTMPLRPDVRYEDVLVLQAVRLSADSLPSGSELAVQARWQALDRLQQDFHVSALLVDAGGRQWAEAHAQLRNAHRAPTSAWLPQETALSGYGLALNPAMPAGEYYLVLRPYYVDSGFLSPSIPATGPAVSGVPVLATIRVLPPAGAATLSTPAGRPESTIPHALAGISFGRHYELLGYDLSATDVKLGEQLVVTLYWAYREPSTVDYKVFVHLLDAASQMQGQCDLVPRGGGAQTTGWVQGDVLVDRFEIPVGPPAHPGASEIEVGFYDLATGKRLPLLREGQPTGEDRLILPATITVR